MNNTFKDYCIRVFSKVNPNATFLSIKGYRNNFHEVSDFSVVFHVNYFNAVKRAQEIISNRKFPILKVANFGKGDFEKAREELLESFAMTLEGNNPLYTCNGVYSDILDEEGKPIPGIKLHDKDNVVHINASRFGKKVKIAGEYPVVNSSSKTIAKRYLKGLTPLSNWVQFKLVPQRFDKLVVQKMVLSGNGS